MLNSKSEFESLELDGVIITAGGSEGGSCMSIIISTVLFEEQSGPKEFLKQEQVPLLHVPLFEHVGSPGHTEASHL